MRWLLVFLMSSCMAFGESIRGVVINVIDGDTITLLEAWIYKKFSASRKLASLEAEARKSKKGLWAEPNPIPPWEWKAAKRREDAAGKFLTEQVSRENVSFRVP